MKNLSIVWQRLLDEREQTCPRCGSTEQEIAGALQELNKLLNPSRIGVHLVKKALDDECFRKDPAQSNKIFIQERTIEEWLGVQTSRSPCCGPCGDAECRTIKFNGQTHETIPADLIVEAGLRAAAQIFGVKQPHRERGKHRLCMEFSGTAAITRTIRRTE